MTKGYRPAISYQSKDPKKRARQLANLKQGRKQGPRVKKPTSFLEDPQNKDIRYFLSNSYYLERGKLINLEPFQIEILDALYPQDSSRPYDLALIGLPRKQGKSSLLAGIILWELLFSENQSPEVYCVAGDEDQAKIVYNKVKKAVKRNSEIKRLCKITRNTIEVEAVDGIFRALAADVDSSYGLNPSACVMDEFATSSWDLWTSLITGMGAREALGEHPIGFLIGTAGWDLTSPFYQLYDKCQRKEKDDSTFFYWRFDMPATFTSQKWIEKMRKRLRPEQFQRFIENKWVQGSGSFVTQEDVNRCIDSTLRPQGKGKPGFSYVLACDLGLTKDRSVTTIVHKDQDQVILDSIRVWEGSPGDPVLIGDIEEDIRTSYKRFNSPKIVVDPWQMKGSVQKFKKDGYKIEEFIFSGSNLAKLSSNLYYLVHNGLLRLWDDPDLIGELLSVQAIEKSYGTRIDHRSGQFSDRVISVGMAALVCVELETVTGGFYVFNDRQNQKEETEEKRQKRIWNDPDAWKGASFDLF